MNDAARALTGGVVCALVTPLGPDEEPDADAMGVAVDHQISAGVHGLFVAGTSGEGPLMRTKERRFVTEAVVEKVADRVPVVIHCGAADTATSQELARHAQWVGGNAVAAVAPYFYRSGQQALLDHYAAIAEAAPDIPHYVYENPERVGYSLGPELVGRLCTEVPNIVGVKDTGDSIGRLMMYRSLFDPAPEVYTGNNSLLFAALSIGAQGAVSALANVTPRLFVAIYEAFRGGRTTDALEMQKVAVRFQACFSGMPYVPAIKHLLERAGLGSATSRRPHAALRREQALALEERVDQCKGLHEWLDTFSDKS
jgi:dihydrodipicolinate synthase/N-acetylneuraminate lyase